MRDSKPKPGGQPTGQAVFAAGEVTLALDRSFRVMGFNHGACQLLGINPAIGRQILLDAIFEGPYLAEAMAAVDAALEQGQPQPTLRLRAIGNLGQGFDCQCSVNPLFGSNEQVLGVILGIRDEGFLPLDPQPAAGETARHGFSVGYNNIFEHLAEGVFTINTNWRITFFNRTAEEITGFKRQEVLGRFCWEIFRSDLCDSVCPLRATLETGVNRMDQDVRILDKDGARVGMLVNTSVVRDHGGAVLGAVEAFRPLSALEPNLSGSKDHSFEDIIGASPAMRRLFGMLPDIARSEASVLIQGESGTGKELFARALHHHSPRRKGPFVAVNCSALVETLLESELFGHERAAFTGAVRSKAGRFELAKGGTLFLDEIGDLKPALQVKLLRVLEQQVFERVGGTRLIPMEARIIAATNQDLQAGLEQGSFRDDLYYRLRTVPLFIPPLRERPEDIPLLAGHFLKKFNAKYKKQVRALDPKLMRMLQDYPWPGNVRELERIIEHAYVFVKGPVIFAGNIPSLGDLIPQARPDDIGDSRFESERQAISEALRQCGSRRQQASQLLGISRTSLWRRMKALGMC